MDKILIAGVAGFIASKVAELLLKEGHSVIGLDNFADSYDVRLKHWRLQQLRHYPGFEFHAFNICDASVGEALSQVHPEIDAVVNLAARAGVRYSVENPKIYFETNLVGTLNLLEFCRRFRVRKFILASTSSVYNSNNPVPFHEESDTNQPLSPYAASKKAAETLCYTYHSLHQLDVSVLRYFSVYGPAGRPDMSPFRFIQWISEGKPVTIYGDGQQLRDFTYVEDIARGTLSALRPCGYQIINLGSNRPLKLLEALRIIEKEVGRPAQLKFEAPHTADMPATWADVSRAHQLLNWEPRTSFEQGIAHTVAWYRTHQAWAKNIRTD